MIRTSSILFWFSLIIIASLGLYRTSNQVQELGQRLHDVNASIDAEKQNLHVLKAEWVYLTNPARVEAVSRRHLALRPTAPQQVATLDMMPEVLPTRAEAMATVAVNATPVANIHTTLAARVATLPVTVSQGAKAKPVTVAANDAGHMRDHMIMIQRTASAAPLPGDSLRNLIGGLTAGR